VNARLRGLDVSGISVDRSTLRLIADAIGVENLPPESVLTPEKFRALASGVTSDAQKAAADAFYRDKRDTSTPEGMARLLEAIWRGRALTRKHGPAARHHAAMRDGTEPHQGPARAPVVVRHKTGTLGIGVANDVGIIDLPTTISSSTRNRFARPAFLCPVGGQTPFSPFYRITLARRRAIHHTPTESMAASGSNTSIPNASKARASHPISTGSVWMFIDMVIGASQTTLHGITAVTTSVAICATDHRAMRSRVLARSTT